MTKPSDWTSRFHDEALQRASGPFGCRASAGPSASRTLLWLGALALTLAACGGQSVVVVTVTRPTEAVWYPTVFHAQTIGPFHTNQRVAGSFDTRTLLGRSVAVAAATAIGVG